MADYVTVKEASKLTGFNQDYLRRLLRENVLPGKRFRLEWRIEKGALLKYAEESGREVARQN